MAINFKLMNLPAERAMMGVSSGALDGEAGRIPGGSGSVGREGRGETVNGITLMGKLYLFL